MSVLTFKRRQYLGQYDRDSMRCEVDEWVSSAQPAKRCQRAGSHVAFILGQPVAVLCRPHMRAWQEWWAAADADYREWCAEPEKVAA